MTEPFAVSGLVLNEKFMHEFTAAEPPCFGMGYLEINGEVNGFFALRPVQSINPADCYDTRFDHSQIQKAHNTISALTFEFGASEDSYDVLLNPESPVIHAVLETMIRTQRSVMLLFNGNAIASSHMKLAGNNLNVIKKILEAQQGITCSEETYDEIHQILSGDRGVHNILMQWVCRNDMTYLDLSTHRYPLAMMH